VGWALHRAQPCRLLIRHLLQIQQGSAVHMDGRHGQLADNRHCPALLHALRNMCRTALVQGNLVQQLLRGCTPCPHRKNALSRQDACAQADSAAPTRDVGDNPVQPLSHGGVIWAGCIWVHHHQGVQLPWGATEGHAGRMCGLQAVKSCCYLLMVSKFHRNSGEDCWLAASWSFCMPLVAARLAVCAIALTWALVSSAPSEMAA
jgi:hypothetical protein